MSFLERLFHAILFETTVVLLSVFALYFFTEESVSILFGSMVLVSLTAMLWNLIFNYFLDKVFTGPREKRGVIFRTLHAISFEGGLLIFTVPIDHCLLFKSGLDYSFYDGFQFNGDGDSLYLYF